MERNKRYNNIHPSNKNRQNLFKNSSRLKKTVNETALENQILNNMSLPNKRVDRN